MKKFLLRQMALALKLFLILLCLFNSAETFAQGTGANTKCYADKDHDGFGNPNDFVFIDPTLANCSAQGRVDNGLDCNDNDSTIKPNTIWYKDADNDNFWDGTTLTQCIRPTGYKTLDEFHLLQLSYGSFCHDTYNLTFWNTIDCDDATPNNLNDFRFGL